MQLAVCALAVMQCQEHDLYHSIASQQLPQLLQVGQEGLRSKRCMKARQVPLVHVQSNTLCVVTLCAL